MYMYVSNVFGCMMMTENKKMRLLLYNVSHCMVCDLISV